MADRVTEKRSALTREISATLGATATEENEPNVWAVAVADQRAGLLSREPPARIWTAKTRTESTVGNLTGAAEIVLRDWAKYVKQGVRSSSSNQGS